MTHIKPLFYRTTSYFRRLFSIKPKKFEIPQGYAMIHYDNFSKLNLDYWHIGEHWGPYHPDKPLGYWDTDGCVSTKDNQLLLDVKYKPKRFDTGTTLGSLMVPYEVGLVISYDTYQYGIFKCEAKMPIGKHLWPAFWLYGNNTWPPELDIFEGYTDINELRPNFFYKKDNMYSKSYGSYNCMVNNCDSEFHEYVLWWEKDFIRMYYDGYKVLEVTDKIFLDKYFNKEKDTQMVVFNNMVTNRIGLNDENPCQQPLIIKNFEIYQII